MTFVKGAWIEGLIKIECIRCRKEFSFQEQPIQEDSYPIFAYRVCCPHCNIIFAVDYHGEPFLPKSNLPIGWKKPYGLEELRSKQGDAG